MVVADYLDPLYDTAFFIGNLFIAFLSAIIDASDLASFLSPHFLLDFTRLLSFIKPAILSSENSTPINKPSPLTSFIELKHSCKLNKPCFKYEEPKDRRT